MIEKADLTDKAVNQIAEILKEPIKAKDKEIERLKKQNKALNEMYELTKKEYIRLNNIIKEVREYIERNKQKTIPAYGDNFDDDFDIALDEEDIDNILEILDKGE